MLASPVITLEVFRNSSSKTRKHERPDRISRIARTRTRDTVIKMLQN